MSSILNSQGVVFATAMAVSGTVILLALRLQKSSPASQFPINSLIHSPPPPPRPCIYYTDHGKKREKKKKRVHFAEDVVDPIGNGEEFRRQHVNFSSRNYSNGFLPSNSVSSKQRESCEQARRIMPANRVALYNGILRDRPVHHRLAYSY